MLHLYSSSQTDQKVPGTKRMTHAQWAERNGFKWLKAGDFKKKDLR